VSVRVKVWTLLVEPTFWAVKVRLEAVTLAVGPIPVPVKLAVCGLPARVSKTLTEAVRVKGAVGENLTEIVQVAFTANNKPTLQVVFSEKSPGFVPVILTLLMVKLAVPVLVTVITVAEVVELTFSYPKGTLAGEKLIWPAVPVPLRPIDCGLAGALSVREMAADSAVTVEGVNVTLSVQKLPAVTGLPHVFPVKAKSAAFAPVTATLVKFKVAFPVFVRVTDSGALVVLWAWLPKLRLEGEMMMVAPEPVPVRLALCVLPATLLLLSVTVTVAERVPGAEGVKVMVMVQLLFPTTEPPQLLD
jgi:hypothetical protein